MFYGTSIKECTTRNRTHCAGERHQNPIFFWEWKRGAASELRVPGEDLGVEIPADVEGGSVDGLRPELLLVLPELGLHLAEDNHFPIALPSV